MLGDIGAKKSRREGPAGRQGWKQLTFTGFECSFHFTRFECGFPFTRFECGFPVTRFECGFSLPRSPERFVNLAEGSHYTGSVFH